MLEARFGRAVAGCCVGVLGWAWLLGATGTASAQATLGNPVDHFEDRREVGQEAVLSLASGSSGDSLAIDRLTSSGWEYPVLGNVPIVNQLPNTPVSEDTTNVQAAIVQADLDAVAGSQPRRGSLMPGVAVAGSGVTADGCPADAGLCVSWRRATHENYVPDLNPEQLEAPRFTGLETPVGDSLPGLVDGTEVALVSGTFDPAIGPSLAVAWVRGPNNDISVANVVPLRDQNGRVTSLAHVGFIENLGPAYADPTKGLTGASLAVGDFSGDGRDELAVAWAPDSSSPTDPKVSTTVFRGAVSGGGFQAVTANPRTFTYPGLNNVAAQITPDVVALRDRDSGPSHRIAIAPGINTDNFLNRGLLFIVSPDGADWEDVAEIRADGAGKAHSEIESVGDLDGDGLDELASTIDPQINGSGIAIEVLKIDPQTRLYSTDGYTPGTGQSEGQDGYDSGQPLAATVLDARPTVGVPPENRQIIAPPTGKSVPRAMPQIAVAYEQTQCRFVGFPQNNFRVFRRIGLAYLALDASGIHGSSQPVHGLTEWIQLPGQTTVNPCQFDSGQPPDHSPPPQLAPFALDGQAELGDPVQGQYTQLEPAIVLNAPPTHFDILDGQSYDPNFCYAGNQYAVPPVCFFKTEYERQVQATTEVTSQATEDWSVSAKVNTDFSLFSVVDVSTEFRGGYGEKYSEDNGKTETSTVDVTVKSLNGDKIYAITRTYDTLEYPLYQPGSATPSGYVLSVTPHTTSKRWIDSSSPAALDIGTSHQPGNILSYPEDVTPAENPFISPDPDSSLATFANDEFELSDSTDYNYSLTQQRMLTDSASTERSWNAGATIGAGGNVAGLVKVKAEVSGDYKNGDIETTKTSVGDVMKLTSSMAGIDESFGETAYVVKPHAYWTENATLVVDYAVEPSVAPPGAPKTWWQQEYGSKPDLTLNLPRLLDYEKQAGISSDASRFISPGVNVLRGDCASPGTLLDSYPLPGQPLCLRAQVENYSLKTQTAGTTVRFYDADPDVGGELIGTDQVPAVGARDAATAEFTWTPDARYAGTRPRIFAVVDAAGQASEIHEDNNKGFRGYHARAVGTVALRAPQDVDAEMQPGRTIEVSWVDESATSQPAGHEWRVAAYPDDGGAPVETTVPGGADSASLQGVPTGRYRVAVFAEQNGASSPASHPSEPVDVVTDEPSAPQNVVATAGNAAVQLSWDPPLDTGGGPVDTYRIEEYRAPGESFPQAPVETTVTGNVTGLTLTGLANGRPYRFTVQAVNSRGAGPHSTPSNAATPLDVTDRPVSVQAQGGAGGVAQVSWQPPLAEPTRAAVTGYRITATPGGAVKDVPADQTEVAFDGLEVGTPYTFKVKANSLAGYGADSEPSTPITLADPPSPPRNVKAEPGSVPGSVLVNWDSPSNSGGVPLDSYEACGLGGSCQRVSAARNEATFTGLGTSTPLTFSVSARNQAGLDSPAAAAQSQVVLDAAPQVTFTDVPEAGSYTGADVAVAFEVSPENADVQCVIDGLIRPCGSPLRLSDLDDGAHSIQVRATSTGGRAQTSVVEWHVDGEAPSASLHKLSKLAMSGVAELGFGGADPGGSEIAGYEIRTSSSGGRGDFAADSVIVDETSEVERARTLAVAEGKTMCVSVRALDGAGNFSPWTNERCTAHPFDERALRAKSKWKRVKGKRFSKRHALMAKRSGAKLSFRIGRSDAVKVLALRCGACGKLKVRYRKQRPRVIDLSTTKRRKRKVALFPGRWPRGKAGRLELIAVGGGKVVVDGVAVWRTR